jgi:hypothetical protein
MQSIVLIAAYIAGQNKESLDMKLFQKDNTKLRKYNKPLQGEK